MRDRLTSLSDEARSMRAQVPNELEPDVARIQRQMQQLGERLSELSGGVLMGSAGKGSTRGADEARRADPEEVIFLGAPSRVEEPWDEASANALTRIYESGEPFLGAKPGARAGSPGAAAGMLQASASQSSGRPRGAPAGAGEASAMEPAWLNDRFAEIARRIEQSLAEIRPESSLLSLGRRFDQLEARMSSVLGGVATRADVEGLRLAEAQIEDIGAQLDRLRRQLIRLDAIDSHLDTLSEQLSDDRLLRLFGDGAGCDTARLQAIDAQLRRISEQLSHDRLADLISENAGRDLENLADAAARRTAANVADRQALEAQSRDIGEVRALVENLIHERRHNDENNASMLETMQQAIIRVLDRIDALELAQQHGAAPVPEAHLAQPAEREPGVQAYVPEAQAVPEPSEPQYEPQYEAPRSSLFRDRDGSASASRPQAPFATVPFDLETAFARDPGESEVSYPPALEPSAKGADSLRHDFIADAHRAKLNAASRVDTSSGLGHERMGETGATLDKGPDAQPRKRRSFFNIRSPRVLMGILTLLAMIPAAMFFMPRMPADGSVAKTEAGAPAYEENAGGANGAAPQDAAPVMQGGEDIAPPPAELPRKQSQRLTPEAPADAYEDAGNPGANVGYEQIDTAAIPSRIALRADAAATVRQLAQTSGQARVSLLAAQPGETPAGLMQDPMPRMNGAPVADAEKPLDLPPATVGPYSLRLAAARGDPSAQFEVAVRLAEGVGTDKDPKQALPWYERSAASGFAIAQFRLGTLYERGLGVQKDLARSRVWYSRAAEQGNVKAMHNLAVLIASRGAQPDYPAAAKWFSEAASRGLADSQYNLAVLYENGLGVKKDLKEAYKWLLLAARSGDGESKSHRDALKVKLSDDERAAAEVMAESWRVKPSNPVANDFRAAGQAWRWAPSNVASRG